MKKFKFKIRGNEYEAVINSFEDNIVEIDINGTSYSVQVEQEVKKRKTPKLIRSKVPVSPEDAKIKTKSILGSIIKAPLPGTIVSVNVKIGDNVNSGDVLLIMEAMKMENNILSEKAGKIKSIHIIPGDTVLQNDLLIEID